MYEQNSMQYGFGDRLSAAFPSQVIVDVTEVCNLACTHCPHPEFKNTPYYEARYLQPELNAKMVDEVRDHGPGNTQYIRYTSEGEPLIHPKGYDMIEDAVLRSGVYVTLTTNGTIMNEKRTQRLLDAGINMIDISIDAFLPETYAKIRVNGNLQITRKNVQHLIDWVRESKSETKVVVSFVEQPENINEVGDFKAFWEDYGADAVVVRRLHSASGAVVPVAELMREQNKSIERRPCVYPWERVVLNPRGFLSFCPADWTHGSTIIDYRSTSIHETWNGSFYQGLRRAHIKNEYQNYKFCGQCPDWAATRWPQEGRAYADLIEELQQ